MTTTHRAPYRSVPALILAMIVALAVVVAATPEPPIGHLHPGMGGDYFDQGVRDGQADVR